MNFLAKKKEKEEGKREKRHDAAKRENKNTTSTNRNDTLPRNMGREEMLVDRVIQEGEGGKPPAKSITKPFFYLDPKSIE